MFRILLKRQITNVGEGINKCGEKEYFWWDCKMMQMLWETVWKFLKKNKSRTTILPSYSTFEYLSEQHKNTNWKKYASLYSLQHYLQ